MWKLIFDLLTNRGTGFNREPGDGEFVKELHHSRCAWFYTAPERYMWDEATQGILEWPGWAGEQLEMAKSIVWERIKADRDRRQNGGFKVGDKWFHSDQSSRLQHLGLKDEARDVLANGGTMESQLLIAGQAVSWKTMDGTFEPLTVQTVFNIVAAGKILDAMLFVKAEQHKGAMAASQDPVNYDFSTGWPENFLGL